MLFANAAKRGVLTIRYIPTTTTSRKVMTTAMTTTSKKGGGGRRVMSTGVPVEETSGGGGGLLVAVGTTFGTYMLADFLSNFLQHPTQKMDYGYFNALLGREVDRAFWGTRTEHIVGVAACLAVTDHASQRLVSSAFLAGKPLAFATHPAAFVAHTFFFIFAGVTLYVAGDAAFNPDIASDKKTAAFLEGTYCSYVGSNTAWFEPYVAPVVAKVVGPAAAGSWLGSALLPATLAYTTVKGVGWNDWGNSGLNDHEMKLNGLNKE